MKKLIIILIVFEISVNSNAQIFAKRIKQSLHTNKFYRQPNINTVKEVKFRFPCGNLINTNYYISQKFNNFRGHLGIDINGINGCNTDLGDTIYASANGIVHSSLTDYQDSYMGYFAILHQYENKLIQFIYLHCDTVFVLETSNVVEDQPIALIGNVGTKCAHLHLEITSDTSISWVGYGKPDNYLNPLDILDYKK